MKHPVTVLNEIPFHLDRDGFFRKIRIESVPELYHEAEEFAGRFGTLAHPKAVVMESYIDDKAGESVVIDGVRFSSPVLRSNLTAVNRVFPHVATCGAELEDQDLSSYDPLAGYWLEVVKEQALAAAGKALREYLSTTFGLAKFSSMNPGSADEEVWPIQQQAGLFSLFGSPVQELIGVRLTESYLMIPNKTISGLFFVSDSEFINCTVCRRENCPNRRAPFILSGR